MAAEGRHGRLPEVSATPPRLIVRQLVFPLLFAVVCACKPAGCVANALGDVVGETGDAHCDRRSVTGADKKAASFCQEIVDTIAQSDFEDDCRDKHGAATGDGTCPREKIIGGCKISKVNDDGSEVWDWYYDVTAEEADGGVFEDPARTKEDVKALCADKQRYDEGATYADPP